MYLKLWKICKKRIFILILALAAMAEFFFVYPDKCNADEKYDIGNIIDSCFNALEDENGYMLCDDIISYAGGTDGDWLAFACGRYERADAYDVYIGALRDYVTSCYQKNSYALNRNKATEWHRIALTVLACGGNPEEFGNDGNGAPINLIADGTYNCKVGKPWKQGINGAAYALITLDSKQYEIPDDALYTREDCIDYILGEELAGGGFSLGQDEADPDVTAIALQALAPYYETSEKVKQAVERSLDRLSLLQTEQGCFASYGEDTAESTAQVLIALTSLNIDALKDERFITASGNTVLDGLMSFNENNEGFCHIHGNGINYMATYQSICALISYFRYENGLGRLYDFTDKNPDISPETPPEASPETPPEASPETSPEAKPETSPEAKPESSPDIKPQNTSCVQCTYNPYSEQKDNLQNDMLVKNENPVVHKDAAVRKSSVKRNTNRKSETQKARKKVITVTKIIKSKDKVITRKEAYVTAGELEKIAGTKHNLKIKTKTKEKIPYSVTFNGKDITAASDMKFYISGKSKYEDKIKSIAEKPYIISVVKKNGLKCKAFVEIKANLKDGEYLLMKYDEKEDKPVFINKISSDNKILRFVIDSGGDYFVTKRVKINAAPDNSISVPPEVDGGISETAESQSKEDASGVSAQVFVPPKNNNIFVAIICTLCICAASAAVYIGWRKGIFRSGNGGKK